MRPPRLARVLLVCAAAGAACGKPAPAGGGGGDGGHGGDGGPDGAPDTTPPSLVAVTPDDGTAAWLHESVHLVFDEPIAAASLAGAHATVQLAGMPVDASLVLDRDPRAIAVVVDPAQRGLGTLDVHVEGTITDVAGNAAPIAADAHVLLPPWSGLAVDRGVATSSPALAVTSTGATIAAWTVRDGGVVVSVLDRGTWTPLGDALGTAAACSPSVALDASERPLVAWSDGGNAHVARWDGEAWSELASPGSGSAVALASPPGGGDPVVAVFGGAAHVAVLAGDAWQPLGGDVALGGVAGEPALAVGAPGHAAIGWIDPQSTLHVSRFDGAWTAMAPIALPPAPHVDRMSLAARGDTIAIAWDAWAGSFGVLAATATAPATSWTRLGHTLDIDVKSDATAPAIAIDATGAPIVAWTELEEVQQRGGIARWDGTAWQIVGGPTWLDATTAVPTRAQLALHGGGAPVVGWSAAGAIGISRFNGPAVAAPGIQTRASIAGCSINFFNPPPYLSQTGCFTITSPGKPRPHAGLIPYDIVSELWTDGAKKRRWMALPDGATMTTLPTGAWDPPYGSFFIKEFAIETTPGNPATRRAIETRFLLKVDAANGWQGFTYRWNLAGTDATLQTDGEYTFNWPMDDGSTHPHLYPSRSECVSCHEASYGPLLGIRAPQLQRWVDYNGVIADQITTLAHLGVHAPTSEAPFIATHDPSESWEHRMRSYMAANCAHCHNPGHIGIWDARYTTPLAQTALCEKIVPGDPADSKVYQLVSSRPGMPPLGTLATDPLAIQMLGSWISGMTSCP